MTALLLYIQEKAHRTNTLIQHGAMGAKEKLVPHIESTYSSYRKREHVVYTEESKFQTSGQRKNFLALKYISTGTFVHLCICIKREAYTLQTHTCHNMLDI